MLTINGLEEGMEVIIIKDNDHRHHGVVTDVCIGRKTFEIVHLTGVTGVTGKNDCQKLIMVFGDNMRYFDYASHSVDKIINTDRTVIKLRAEVLFKIFHELKDIKYDPKEFNCDHFASYCVAGSAYSKKNHKHNKTATKALDTQ